MNSKFLCAGNWKMNKGPGEAREFFCEFLGGLSAEKQKNVSFFVSGYNWGVAQDVLGKTDIHWGAQNCFYEKAGAYTGENSAAVLKEMGGTQCLVGHSERRQIFKESDEWVHKKIRWLQSLDITPIVCVGETWEEREAHKTEEVVLGQVKSALKGEALEKGFILAYEPVWAIGTGKVATPEMAEEVHSSLRTLLKEKMGPKGEEVFILYGGSVKPENCRELFAQPNIDGFLVGGASLKVESFLALTDVI